MITICLQFGRVIFGTALGKFALLLILPLFSAPVFPEQPAVGSLLVATPSLRNSGFEESVVLLIQHDENGTMGLIINQPTQTSAAEMLPEMESLQGYQGKLYVGGPVAPWGVIMLIQSDQPPTDALVVIEGVYTSGDQALLQNLVTANTAEEQVRLYAGHAGWFPGQLDAEILRGSWEVIPARRELVFSRKPLELWQQLTDLRKQIVVQAQLPAYANRAFD